MSNYSSVKYNIRLSKKTPPAVFKLINMLQKLSPVADYHDEELYAIPGFREFIKDHNWESVIGNNGQHRDGKIDVKKRPMLNSKNTLLKLDAANQYANSSVPELLKLLKPYITNKDELLAFVRDEYDCEHPIEGRLYYFNGRNLKTENVCYVDKDVSDFVDAFCNTNNPLIKWRNVIVLEPYYPNNPFC